MKTSAIILLVSALSNYLHPMVGDDTKYAEAMSKNIQTVYTSQSAAELLSAVNALERIASAEKTKWEPYYYTAFFTESIFAKILASGINSSTRLSSFSHSSSVM